jgi:hypothetical protein
MLGFLPENERPNTAPAMLDALSPVGRTVSWLNPWRSPADPRGPLAELLASIFEAIQERRALDPSRRRLRVGKTTADFKRALAAVICDALYRRLIAGESGAVFAISLDHRRLVSSWPYGGPEATKALPSLLADLDALDFLRVTKGTPRTTAFGRGTQTIAEAGPALVAAIERLGLTPAAIVERDEGETIVLRADKEDDLLGEGLLPHDKATGQPLKTIAGTVKALRSWQDTINAALAHADLGCAPKDGAFVDVRARRLRRIFNNGSFREGGRLFGGFWQPMPKAERFARLTIAGEPVVELDFSSMFLRLAYAENGSPVDWQDGYALHGFTPEDNRRYRDAFKIMTGALFFARRKLTAYPDEAREALAGVSLERVRTAIRATHRPIADLFERGIGWRLLRRESDVLVRALLDLIERGVIGLPLHDAIIVAQSQEAVAVEAMRSAFVDVTDTEPVITRVTAAGKAIAYEPARPSDDGDY